MKMECWIMNTDHNLWKVIQNGNSKKSLRRDSKGRIIILPPVSFEEHVVVQRETKARTLLLQSLPEDHMADFHHLDDAREIWLAVKARFGGNEESKKMRKTMLKQEFFEFCVSEEEGLHKGYDRFQKILSQLNQMQTKPDNDDVNLKFLRALPPSWSLEIDVKGRSSYGSRGTVAPTHSAFIGATSTTTKIGSTSFKRRQEGRLTLTTKTLPEHKPEEGEQVYGLMAGFKLDFADPAVNAAGSVYDVAAEFAMMGISPKYKHALLTAKIEKKEWEVKLLEFLASHMGAFVFLKPMKGVCSAWSAAKEGGFRFLFAATGIAMQSSWQWLHISSGSGNQLHWQWEWGNIVIARVYFVEGLGHNLFSVGQFCDSDLEVAFRRNACFVRNLEGVDLLKGDRSTNLYTINLHEMASASPICLMARASSTKSWLWHQRLSHLNFDTINDLAKNDFVAGLLKFKYHKEHLCPSCEKGKSKRASRPPKPVPNLRQRLHLLHMDLCGPMRITSINGKRYILVIVDVYSRYTWVHFLRSKDEAPIVIITFLKRITVLLQSPVIIIRTDNGTEFKNQGLKVYFDSVGITHQMYYVQTPQQNGVVERQNRTLVEAARTMLIFSRAPLFLWLKRLLLPSVPAGSMNSSASTTADSFIPTASRNRSTSIHAGRSIPTASRNRPSSIYAGGHIPAGRSNMPAPFSAGRTIPTGWINHAARPFFGPTNLYFDNVYWPGIYNHMSMNKERWGSAVHPHVNKDFGIVDSGCSRSMTGNKEKLADFVQVKGGTVTFGGGDGKITGKGTIRTSKLDFENVYYVEELQNFNLFSVSQICDKRTRHDLYTFNLSDIQSEQHINCLLAKASLEEFTKWHRRMAHVNFKTINKLAKLGLVKGLPLKLFTNEHNCVACNKGKQHKASYKTVSATEAVSTACYVLNRVSITNPHNKTPYELLSGKIPNIRHLKPFGCQVTILNTSDYLGKFEGKANDGFLVGYAAHSKAYRVYNLSSKKDVSAPMENNLDYAEELARLQRQEYEAHFAAAKHGFEFSIDTTALLPQANIEIRRNLVPAVGDPAGGIVPTGGVPAGSDPAGGIVPTGGDLAGSSVRTSDVPAGSISARSVHAGGVLAGSLVSTDSAASSVPAASVFVPAVVPTDSSANSPLPLVHSLGSYLNVAVDPIATKRVNFIHPQSQILGDLQSPVQTWSTMQKSKFNKKPSSVATALADPDWVAAMQEEMQHFYHQQRDARGIVVQNKARLVSQGHRKEEGIDYDECKKQTVVATSSTKAEYVVAASCCGQDHADDLVSAGGCTLPADSYSFLLLDWFLLVVATATVCTLEAGPSDIIATIDGTEVVVTDQIIFQYEVELGWTPYASSGTHVPPVREHSPMREPTLAMEPSPRPKQEPTPDSPIPPSPPSSSAVVGPTTFSRPPSPSRHPSVPEIFVRVVVTLFLPLSPMKLHKLQRQRLLVLGGAVLKLVTQVKRLEGLLQQRKRRLVLSDSKGEDATTTEQEFYLAALHTLASATLGDDSSATAVGPDAETTMPVYSTSTMCRRLRKKFTSSVSAHVSETIHAGVRVPATASTIPAGSSIDAVVHAAAPSSSIPTATDKGKAPMVDDSFPADLLSEQERILKNLHDSQLGEELAKKIHAEQEAEFARQQEELAQKAQAKSVASPTEHAPGMSDQRRRELDAAQLIYTEADWLDLLAKTATNSALSKHLLGNDVMEENMNEQLGMLLLRKRLLRFTIKDPTGVPAAPSILADVSLPTATSSAPADIPVPAISIAHAAVSVPAEPMVHPAESHMDPPLTAPAHGSSEPTVAAPPLSSSHHSRKHIAKKRVTLIVDVADAAMIKFNCNSDCDDDPLPYASYAGWEMVPSLLGSVHAYHNMTGHTKHFTSLREILHIGDLHVLFQSLDDKDALHFWRTLERMLKHGLEVSKLLVGGDLTMAEQLIGFIKVALLNAKSTD
uniref:Putative ribonuclease H-like domain-containing protein n=1 Tax=Tanacetum cinerariifolium TaxID=118510 RepID=A0A6L2KF32_TANCI|nr:putative ribonuclease H-like domain-containing protein [Tanacetum cinerariifolium]